MMLVFHRIFNRYYNDYAPLGPHPAAKRPPTRLLVFAALVLLSFVFNLVVVLRYVTRWTSPLDDFQALCVPLPCPPTSY